MWTTCGAHHSANQSVLRVFRKTEPRGCVCVCVCIHVFVCVCVYVFVYKGIYFEESDHVIEEA